LKISLRNILKHKIYSSINVFGLALGFTAFILVGLFIQYDLSWDKTNLKYDRIYRVQRHFVKNRNAVDRNDISPHTPPLTAQLLEKQFPDFEKITVIRYNGGKYLGSDPSRQIFEESGFCADSCLFNVFTYHFLEGEQTSALTEPFTVVLSKTMADKLFPGGKALGKSVTIEKKFDVKVTGVYADLPENSSVRPSYVVSFSSLDKAAGIKRNSSWTGDCMTYALLKPGVEYKTVGQKIKNVYKGFKGAEFEELQLCPLSKIFLSFDGRNDYLIVLTLFGLIGLFILIMSAFNYINLTTANSAIRGKEVAVKKVCGSNRSSLIAQFLGETIIIAVIALVIAFFLAWIFLPVFSSIIDKHLELSFRYNGIFIGMTLGIAIFVGLLSGIYPALFLSSKKIVSLFKGNLFDRGNEKINLRKALVTGQFAISIFLILLTLSFSLQIRYLSTRDMGFNKENMLFTKLSSSRHGITFEALRNRLLRYPEIIDASMSEHLPFISYGGGMVNWEGGEQDDKVNYRPNSVSYDFVKNMGIAVLTGRDFSRDYPGDLGKSCLINETAAKTFGWDNPIGKRINNNEWTVVGVMKDYVYKDIHGHIEPAVLLLAPDEIYGGWSFAFRVDPRNEQKAKAILTREFEAAFPNDPFEFSDMTSAFLYEHTFKIYHSINRTFVFFTVFNIFLAVIGLLGLVSFTVLRRTKEIGVRKINGCSAGGIFYLLNREYFTLLIVSLLFSFPGGWWAYEIIPGAFKFHMQPWVFILATGIILFIILLTTNYQTLKAATRNPVEALRYE
jgi:putative ABC transport system permease protein